MAAIFLRESDVGDLLTMNDVIEAMEGAFRALAEGQAQNTPRRRTRGDGVLLHSMSASADYLGLIGWKEYTTTRAGAHFYVGLSDQSSGELVAFIEADRLGQMRTGATTGLACRLLAPPGAETLGLFGAGWQAESQLEAAATALPLRRTFVFSRDSERRARFAERMSKQLGLQVVAVEQAEEAARQPIVITATSSRTPVLDSSWLPSDGLVCAMGSNWLEKAEIDADGVGGSARVVCDNTAACRVEAGELEQAMQAGRFRWDQAQDLSDYVIGARPARPAEGRTLFKSVGLAVEDVAIGALLLKRAREAGRGGRLG